MKNRFSFYFLPIKNGAIPVETERDRQVARLRDDKDQLLTANEFVGAAENAGLMGQIDHTVILRCVQVLRRLSAHLVDDGRIVVGFHTNRELALTDFDAAVIEAGLHLDLRLATWDLRPWHDGADFAVSILRRADEQ